MTILYCVDFLPTGRTPVAIEPRLPRPAFPEHHHDFHEIMVIEHGTGVHVFNGQPYTISGGTVYFVCDHNRHLYEHTDDLCLTNVLYRSLDAFQFPAGLNQLLPWEQNRQYPFHRRMGRGVSQQVQQLVGQMEALSEGMDTLAAANREILSMQLLVLLCESSLMEAATDNDTRFNLPMTWLEGNLADEVRWEVLVEKLSFPLCILHRQLKQQTGLTPRRYLNHLRLIKARHLLRHSDDSVIDAAYPCGSGDSNHFSTLFRREFEWSPCDIRRGHDPVVVNSLQ